MRPIFTPYSSIIEFSPVRQHPRESAHKVGVVRLSGRLQGRYPINLARHDEIIFVQSFDLLGRQRDGCVTPAETEIGVMTFGLCKLPDFLNKGECFSEIAESEGALDAVGFVIQLPFGSLCLKALGFVTREWRDATETRCACLFGKRLGHVLVLGFTRTRSSTPCAAGSCGPTLMVKLRTAASTIADSRCCRAPCRRANAVPFPMVPRDNQEFAVRIGRQLLCIKFTLPGLGQAAFFIQPKTAGSHDSRRLGRNHESRLVSTLISVWPQVRSRGRSVRDRELPNRWRRSNRQDLLPSPPGLPPE